MPTDAEIQRELDAIDDALAGRPVEHDLTELGTLALALRDERPEIDPRFAGQLDTRVAAGFPKESRRSRFATWLSPRTMLVPGVAMSMLLAVLVSAAVLTSQGDNEIRESLGAKSDDSVVQELSPPAEDSTSGGGAARPTKTTASGAAPAISELQPSSSTPLPTPPPPTGGNGSPRADRKPARKVERAASMTLVAKPDEVQNVADRIIRVVDEPGIGGFVVSSSVNTNDGGGGGSFLLRVPTNRLDGALARLSQLAHVSSREQSAQDITAEHTSARARLQNARAERKSLLRRLAKATTDLEAAAIKAQLRDVGTRIAVARTDLARVANRASFSNVSVSLTSDPQATDPEDEGGAWAPGDALRDALRILEVAAGVAVIAIAIALPLGLLIALGVLASRWAARRGRRRVLDAV